MKNELSIPELEKLKVMTEAFERKTLCETAVGKISGGFAVADMFNYDDDYIDIELKWGIQNECEDNIHTERYKINRRKPLDEWEYEDA